MLSLVLGALGYLAMAAACGFAILRGDRAARWTADAVALGWIASTAVHQFSVQGNRDPQLALAALDLILLGLFLALAHGFRRIWLAWISAFQLLILASHIAFALEPRLRSFAFLTLYYVWSYLVLAALVVGAWQGRVRRQAAAGSAGMG